MHARQVVRVVYANDNTVILDWEVHVLINDPEPQVAALREAATERLDVQQRS